MGGVFRVEKSPNEKFAIGLKYIEPDLEEDETISTCVVTISPSGLTAVGSPVITDNQVAQIVEGGTDGSVYKVIFKSTTSGGHIYEDMIYVKVRDL